MHYYNLHALIYIVSYFKTEESGKIFGKIKLIRPLPWFLFLPGLVILRIIRCTINIGAYIFGYPLIQPITVVRNGIILKESLVEFIIALATLSFAV
jgi:hypothetical protein